MKTRLYVATFLALALTTVVIADWPLFRGNSLQNGIATSKLPDALEIVWKVRAKDGVDGTAAIVDKVVDKHGTRKIAEAYLEHLYSPQGQQLAAKHYYRPTLSESISAEERNRFAAVELFTIDDAFGGWDKAQATHFDDGGIFDQIYQPGK